MKVVLIIIAVIILISVLFLIFILLNPPNTIDKDCKYNPEKGTKLSNRTVNLIVIIGGFISGLILIGFIIFIF